MLRYPCQHYVYKVCDLFMLKTACPTRNALLSMFNLTTPCLYLVSFFDPVFLIHDSAFLKCIHNTPECIFNLLMFKYHSPIILLWSIDWLYNKPSIHHSPPPPPLTHPFKFCSFCYPVLGVISVSVTETCNTVVIPFNSSLDIYIYCH